MKLSTLIVLFLAAAAVFLAGSALQGAINVRGPKRYQYSETSLLAVNVAANQFRVQGKENPSETLTLFVSPMSKFFRNGVRVPLREAKLGDEASGSFIITLDHKATVIETIFTSRTLGVKSTKSVH